MSLSAFSSATGIFGSGFRSSTDTPVRRHHLEGRSVSAVFPESPGSLLVHRLYPEPDSTLLVALECIGDRFRHIALPAFRSGTLLSGMDWQAAGLHQKCSASPS